LIEEGARLYQILLDLSRQRTKIGKGHFIAQFGQKADIKVRAIEVTTEIKEVYFQ
jgi:hypothetical protein